MRENHLTYFKVENFKRFGSFEMSDIGQFNLVVGDNNTGKTTLLEALLFDENIDKLVNYFYGALNYRDIQYMSGQDINIFKYFYNTGRSNNILFKYVFQGNQAIKNLNVQATTINNLNEAESAAIRTRILQNPGRQNLVKVSIDGKDSIDFQLFQGQKYFPFIPYGLGYRNDLVGFFPTIQQSTELLNEFINNLKLFIPTISNVEVSIIPDLNNLQMLIIREEDRDQPLPLTMYGEGAVKLFRILLEIIICKGQRLMIDEIDTGIHWSRFKQFWKTIIKAAVKNDVQVFASTHDLECLQYFKECLEDDDMKEYQSLARCFEFRELSKKNIKAYNYNFEQFESALDSNTNLRGGKVGNG
jgi:AAA15 family ATPase/GTPase